MVLLLKKSINIFIDVDCIFYNVVVDGFGLYFYYDVSGKNRSVLEILEVRFGCGWSLY